MLDNLQLDHPFPRILLTSVLLVNLLIAALVWFSLQNSKSHYDRQTEVATRNISQVLDENISGIFSRVDICLQAVADEVEHQLASGGVREDGLNSFIIRQHSRLPELLSLRATNAAGDAIYGPKTKVATTTSLAHRDYFKQLRDTPDAGLVISKPLVGGITGKKMVVLARRINRPDGGFAGLVYAGLAIDYLTRSFAAPDVGAHGAISLLDADLAIVARYPELKPLKTETGPNNVSPELNRLISSGMRSATYRSTYVSDGIRRLSSYRRISHQQKYYIVTGVSVDNYLAAWRTEVVMMCLYWSAASFFSILFAWLFYKKWRTTREAELAVMKSDQRFRQFVENANDLIYSLSPTGIITYVTPNVESLLGYNSSELIGTPFQPLIHHTDLPACLHFLQEILTTGIRQNGLEYRIRHKNGDWLWFVSNASIVTDASTNEPVFLGIGHNISELKQVAAKLQELNEELEQRVQERTEAAERSNRSLRESNERFVKMFNNAPTMMSISTLEDGRCFDINQRFIEVSGFSREDVIGKTFTEVGLIHAEERRKLVNAMLNSKNVYGLELTYFTKSGRPLLWSYSGQAIQLGGENYLLSSAIDITEHRAMELRLQQSQKLDAIGQLTGGIAHDFNNKLMVILGYASLAQMDIANSANVSEYLDGITNAAEQSRQMTLQLLGFSRRQLTIPVVLDINRCIEETGKMLPRLIGENISFTYRLAENLWHIRIDPVQFDQIIMNIAVNARDAMPDGGSFTIETRNTTCNAEWCRNKTGMIPGDYACILFSDTGIGIDRETLQHIFEPFFTTKEQGKGTGLGLATIHGIVHQNGGVIDVDSTPGNGTVFSFFFPRCDETVKESDGGEDAMITGNGSILLVEDEDPLREMVAVFLRKIGYTVYMCESPGKALEIASDHSLKLDLVLSDVIMPGMNGVELVEHIQQIRPGIKAFFVSGYSSNYSVLEAAATDGYFMQKPYDLKKLSQILGEVLK